jgi:hypothetical protein
VSGGRTDQKVRSRGRHGIRGWLGGLAVPVIAILVAGIAIAAVIVFYHYPVSSQGKAPQFYLEQGSNYDTANSLGLFHATSQGTPSNISGGTTLFVNTTFGSSDTYLLNVLDVYNATSATLHKPVYLWVNGTLPTDVWMYYASSPITFTGSPTPPTLSGTNWTSGAQISLSVNAGPAVEVYFAFVLTGTASGVGDLYFQYSITG